MMTCQGCMFWLHANAQNGSCRHSAPRPTEAADQIANWPETFAAEGCGEGLARAGATPIIGCDRCVFWRQFHAGEPAARLGRRADWWQHSGHCTRYAPGPSSQSGNRGFWRVTHTTDGCAQGLHTAAAASDAEP